MKVYYQFFKRQFFSPLLLVLLLSVTVVLSAQNEEIPKAQYMIAEVSYEVDGKTKENLLENYMEIKKGESFLTFEALQAYLHDKQIYLNNKRIFSEGTVSIERIEKSGDDPDKVYVKVWAKDTWNIIALPYIKYDSNDGLLLSLRGRNYNFLGSMEKLAFNLDYQYTEDQNHLFSLNGDFSIPLILWDRDWVYDIDYNIEYEEAVTETYPIYLNLDTDLGYYFTLFDKRWRANLSTEYSLNDRNSEPDPGEEAIPDEYYLTNGLSVGGPVATGLSVGQNDISWNPKISTSVSYVPGKIISKDRRGVSGTFSQSIGWGRINWEGNFRSGYTFSFSNSNNYYFHTDSFSSTLNTESEYFKTWGWGGLNSRVQGFYLFAGEKNNAGGPLRGILDSRIDDVEAGAYLNIDLPFNMWIWFMSRWFEGHLSPFVDIGVFHYGKDAQQSDPFWYSAGIEAFAFPKFARSFYLRISAGVDLQAFLNDFSLNANAARDDEPRLELFVGLGHHY